MTERYERSSIEPLLSSRRFEMDRRCTLGLDHMVFIDGRG